MHDHACNQLYLDDVTTADDWLYRKKVSYYVASYPIVNKSCRFLNLIAT